MKRYLVLSAVVLASCTGNGNQKNRAVDAETPEQDKHYCFQRTEGTNDQDTTTVHFTLLANNIEGEMEWVPYEKDSRKGTLTGTVSGDEITAVWSYMQEGVKDSIVVAFKLSAQQLAQKPLRVNTVSGRQETDKDADYTLVYLPYDCVSP